MVNLVPGHRVIRNESVLRIIVDPGGRAIAVRRYILRIAAGGFDLVHGHANGQTLFDGPFVFRLLWFRRRLSLGRLGGLSRRLAVAGTGRTATKAG